MTTDSQWKDLRGAMRETSAAVNGARCRRQQFMLVVCAGFTLLLPTVQAQLPTIRTTPATIQPDNVEPVQGDCAAYQTALISPGVQEPLTTNHPGATHPGYCRYSDFEPLFDGKSLSDYWASATQGSSRPFKRSIAPATSPVRGWCARATMLKVTLSANLQVSRLDWTPTPAGAMCTKEWNRVNPALSINQSALTSRADALVRLWARTLQNTIGRSNPQTFPPGIFPPTPAINACASTRAAALGALDTKVKTLLQSTVDRERRLWAGSERSFDDPGAGAFSRCTPQCGLCSTGWVGTIQCKKSITQSGASNYEWNEIQTWFVGGPSQVLPGQTLYPYHWNTTGAGSKIGCNWTISASDPTGGPHQMAEKADPSGQPNIFGYTSRIDVVKGIPGTCGTANDDTDATEYALPTMVGSPGATRICANDSDPSCSPSFVDTDTTRCSLPQKPGDVQCKTTCTWDLVVQ